MPEESLRTQMPLNSPAAEIETALAAAQASCHKADWAKVIANCQAAIAQCKQQLSGQNQNAQNQGYQQPGRQPSQAGSATETTVAQTTAALHQAKGDLYKSQGQTELAIQAYRQALALSPDLNDAKTGLGETYSHEAQQLHHQGDTTGAVRRYLQAIEQQPRLFTAYTRLRYNLMRYNVPAGDPILKEIVAAIKQVVQQHPDILPAQVALAYALTKLGDKKAAIACYQQVNYRLTQRQLAAHPQQSALLKSAQRRPPNFMIIGAEKCGTTSLYHYLRQHPAVLPPIEKEIDFFDMEYEQGLEWYLAHFPAMPKPGMEQEKEKAPSNWITGETSPNYLYSNVAPERVAQHFSDIKLAVILRHPIDRAVSRYSMMVRNGAEKRSFETAVTEEMALIQQATTADDISWPVLNRCRHLGNGLYYYHLKRWLTCFAREQLLVLRSEDLFATPESTLTQLYSFLGLSQHSAQTYPKHNSGDYPPIDSDIRQQLADFFAPHIRKLENLLAQSFDWDM